MQEECAHVTFCSHHGCVSETEWRIGVKKGISCRKRHAKDRQGSLSTRIFLSIVDTYSLS